MAMTRRQDPVFRSAQMVFRFGALIALVLGLTNLFGWQMSAPLRGIHMLTGILAFAAIWVMTVRAAQSKRSAGLLWASALLLTVGAGIGMYMASGAFGYPFTHFIVNFCAIGLAEAGASKLKRTA
jgi:hypothetical protein